MTRDEAQALLIEYGAVAASRDDRVRAAISAGISKRQVHLLTGIGRMTVDRIMASEPDSCASPETAQAEGDRR